MRRVPHSSYFQVTHLQYTRIRVGEFYVHPENVVNLISQWSVKRSAKVKR